MAAANGVELEKNKEMSMHFNPQIRYNTQKPEQESPETLNDLRTYKICDQCDTRVQEQKHMTCLIPTPVGPQCIISTIVAGWMCRQWRNNNNIYTCTSAPLFLSITLHYSSRTYGICYSHQATRLCTGQDIHNLAMIISNASITLLFRKLETDNWIGLKRSITTLQFRGLL